METVPDPFPEGHPSCALTTWRSTPSGRATGSHQRQATRKAPRLTPCTAFRRCLGTASCSQMPLRSTRLGKKPENQDKSRVRRTLRVSRPTLYTHQGALIRPRCSGPCNSLVHGAAVPVAGDGTAAVRRGGPAAVRTPALLQTQQQCVIYTARLIIPSI